MILDNEMQRKFILAAINTASWPGQIIEDVIKLKIAVASAPAPVSDELVEQMKED